MHWLLLIITLVVLPFIFKSSTFILTIMNLTMIYTMAGMGLNLIMGYTGQVSIGHAAFMSIGAYTSAILTQKLSIPLPLSLICATAIGGIFGLALGFPALRLAGFYLAIATMGFGIAIEQLFGALENFTGGHIGIRNITKLGSELESYYIILILIIVAFYFFNKLVNGKTGRALKAIRENELVANVLGVNLTHYKVLSFVIGSAYAGLAGALYAHVIGYISPADFGLGKSLELLAVVVIGGMGMVSGPIFGAVFYTVLPFFLSRVGFSLSIIFGSVLVLVVLFMPRGIAYYAQRFWFNWAELPLIIFKRKKVSPDGDYVELSFGKMHYVQSGDGEKVILCIHGNFGSYRWYKPMMEKVHGYKIIAIDLPNFGDSSRSTVSLDFYADSVHEFIEKMQIKPSVIAHSLGGAVAMLLAKKYPDSIASLILVDPCPADGLVTPNENLPYLKFYKRSRILLKKSLTGLLRKLKDKKYFEQLVDDALKMNPESIYTHAIELGKFRLSIDTYSVPTVVVYGDLDPLLTKEQMLKTAETLKAKLIVLESVGHTPFIEVPDLFIETVKNYL